MVLTSTSNSGEFEVVAEALLEQRSKVHLDEVRSLSRPGCGKCADSSSGKSRWKRNRHGNEIMEDCDT